MIIIFKVKKWRSCYKKLLRLDDPIRGENSIMTGAEKVHLRSWRENKKLCQDDLINTLIDRN